MTNREYIKKQIDILPEETIDEIEKVIKRKNKNNPFAEFIGKLDDESAQEMLEALEECRQIKGDERIYFDEK